MLVAPYLVVGLEFVSEQGGAHQHRPVDERDEHSLPRPGDDLGSELVGLPTLGSHHYGLALLTPPAPCPFSWGELLGEVLVLLLPTHVGFVHLHHAPGEGNIGAGLPRLPDAMGQMPRTRLPDFQAPVELYGGNAFQIGEHHVQGEQPLAIAERGTPHYRAAPSREEPPARAAAEPQRSLASRLVHVVATTSGAVDSVRPAGSNEEFLGGLVIGEHIEEFLPAYSLAPVLPRPLANG